MDQNHIRAKHKLHAAAECIDNGDIKAAIQLMDQTYGLLGIPRTDEDRETYEKAFGDLDV